MYVLDLCYGPNYILRMEGILVHDYYHVEGLTDLAVMREQANARTKPNSKWGMEPEGAIIHHHKFSIPCEQASIGHEYYLVPKETPNGAQD